MNIFLILNMYKFIFLYNNINMNSKKNKHFKHLTKIKSKRYNSNIKINKNMFGGNKFITPKEFYFIHIKEFIDKKYFKISRSIEYFEKDNDFIKKKMNFNEFLHFLNSNKESKKKIFIVIIFNNFIEDDHSKFIELMNFSKSLPKTITIIRLGIEDQWYNSSKPKLHNYINLNCFKYDRIKNTTHTHPENLGYLLNQSVIKYKKNFLEWQPHNCYPNSIMKINNYPINKILVSGRDNPFAYPERVQLLKFNNVVKKKTRGNENDESDYSKFLNKYICCFASTFHPENLTLGNSWEIRSSSHIILEKVYEILASGSLLLYPLSEYSYLENIGLRNGKHFLYIDMSSNHKIISMINFILNPINRVYIDKIRFSGYRYACNHLTSEKVYQNLKDMIFKL